MKENISVNISGVSAFVSYEEIAALAHKSLLHLDALNSGTGPGNNFLGWLRLPENITVQLERIEKTARHLRSVSDATVVVGIGGSYLGTRAVIEALSHSFPDHTGKKHHEIYYAGHNICEEYLSELLEILEHKNYSILVISKSGVTTFQAA